jgi:hypothetical protein
MENQTKPEPYLSDERIAIDLSKSFADDRDRHAATIAACDIRDHYEPELQRLRAENDRLRGTTNFEVVPKEAYDRLREVAEAIIKQWHTPNWKLRESTGAIINRAESVLAENGIKPSV